MGALPEVEEIVSRIRGFQFRLLEASRFDGYQTCGIVVRQRTKNDSVHDAEYGSVCPDTQGQCENGDHGKARTPPERPNRVAQVVSERAHGVTYAGRTLLRANLEP